MAKFGDLTLGVTRDEKTSKNVAASIINLIAFTANDMARVDEMILSMAGSDFPLISEVANHLIASGGKRLRPMLSLATSRMFGYEGEGHLKLAASVEFMHTATLLHDDVVDESDLRRGNESARTIWGNQASVLVGDYLLGQAFQIMVDAGSMEALRILSNAASVIARGEVMQLVAVNNLQTTEEQYLAIIEAKTATLFSAASEIGPIIAQSSQASRLSMRTYGQNLGLAFQLIDDALDYMGSAIELGKNIGNDFREGKVTLPVILSYSRSQPDEQSFWKNVIEGHSTDENNFQRAMDLMIHHKAIEDTIARARYFADIAQKALAPLPPSYAKSILGEIIDFCINRGN